MTTSFLALICSRDELLNQSRGHLWEQICGCWRRRTTLVRRLMLMTGVVIRRWRGVAISLLLSKCLKQSTDLITSAATTRTRRVRSLLLHHLIVELKRDYNQISRKILTAVIIWGLDIKDASIGFIFRKAAGMFAICCNILKAFGLLAARAEKTALALLALFEEPDVVLGRFRDCCCWTVGIV